MFGHHSKTYYKYLASYGALLLTAIIALEIGRAHV